MAINSREFVCQLRSAAVFCLNFTWAHPMISILLCTSVFMCILFPKVFKLLIFSVPLIVSTALFLAAILSITPQPKEPGSKRKGEKPTAECHEDGRERTEIEIKRLAVVSRNEEAHIADFADQTLVGERTEIDDNAGETEKFADGLPSNNAGAKGVEIMESVEEGEDLTEHGRVEEEEEEEAINDMDSSHGSPQGFVVEETAEESFLVEQPNSSSVSESDGEEEEEGKVCPQNFFALPLHSSWKRFDSSSDSGSEGSVGKLGPLFDGIDPVVFGEDPNAGEEDASVDFRPWTKDEGDENLFELFHPDGSDSLSEDENLIEIAVSEEQVMERQGREMPEIYVQEQNLICLNNSNGESLGDKGSVQEQNLISLKRATFPEEENLIEIDLSIDTFVVAAHEETSPAEIGSGKVENSTVLTKENPIDSSQLKSPTDLLNEPIHGESSVLADQAQPSESKQKNTILEGKSIQEIESTTEEVAAQNLTCKHEQIQDGSHQQSTKTVELIDTESSPVTEMQIAEEDEHLNPEKTEQPSDDSTTSCTTGIQQCNATTI